MDTSKTNTIYKRLHTLIITSIIKRKLVLALLMSAIFSMLFPLMDYFFRGDDVYIEKIFPRFIRQKLKNPGFHYPEILDLQV
jgi:hypothetical protein